MSNSNNFLKDNWMALAAVIAFFLILPILKGIGSVTGVVGDILSLPRQLIDWIGKHANMDDVLHPKIKQYVEKIVSSFAYIAGEKRSENLMTFIKELPTSKWITENWKKQMIAKFKIINGKKNTLDKIGTLAGFGSGVESLYWKDFLKQKI